MSGAGNAPGLKSFSAKVSYRLPSGYASEATFSTRFGTPSDAVFAALMEIAAIAELAGWGDEAAKAVSIRVADVRRVQADRAARVKAGV